MGGSYWKAATADDNHAILELFENYREEIERLPVDRQSEIGLMATEILQGFRDTPTPEKYQATRNWLESLSHVSSRENSFAKQVLSAKRIRDLGRIPSVEEIQEHLVHLIAKESQEGQGKFSSRWPDC